MDHDDGSFVDRLYEAAVLPEFWRPVLQQFALVAESTEAIVIATDGIRSRWVSSSDHYSDMAQKHYAYPGALERTRRLMQRRHPGFLTETDVYDIEELKREPLYTDFMIPNGYGRGIATAIEVPGGETIVFHAEGPFDPVPLRRDLLLRLDGLRPHLARSALVAAQLGFERARTAVETLAGLGFAACAVRQSGSVLFANLQFEAEGASWTTRGFGRIALLDRRADALLSEGLRSIHLNAGVRSIPLRGRPEAGPGVLHVVPVRRAAHDLFGQATAILVLPRASSEPTARTPLLQALFDLSPVEASVAARIAAGRSVEEIATADVKSVHTVRNQLKSVLAKTGCTRQADLARLLGQLVPR